MSSEEQKPVVAETPTAEPAPATETPAPAAEANKPAEEPTKSEETKAEAPATTEEQKPEAATETPAAPAEEKKEKKEKVVEPTTGSTLEYKAPGFPKGLIFSKKYFWLGEEAVPTSNLSSYLRGEKPDVAHPTAAWSSQTGKGLLYFVKHPDNKSNPSGVLCLADATDLAKDGTNEFLFKANGHKHVFRTNTLPERDEWFKAIKKAVEEAKTAKEGIVGSDGYKEVKDKLSKPFTVPVAAAKAESSTPKKSAEVKPEEGATRDNASSSGSDEEKKKKKSKSKSRSVSRGKRASILGSLLGKKEEHDAKKDEKKEEKAEEKAAEKEEKKEGETAAAAAGTSAPLDGPATAAHATDAPSEETKPAETEAPAEAKETEAAKDAAIPPKPVKRGSFFGTFVEKLRSPTHEKKESEIAPAVPAKDTETPAAPAATETAEEAKPTEAAPATTEAATEAKPEEKPAEKAEKATTPHKEKKNFFDSFLHKEKAKTPTTEAAPAEAKKEEKPAEETKSEEKPAEKAAEATEPATGVTATASAATPEASKDKRRTSFFGNLTGSVKKEKSEGETDGEPKHSKLGGLFRNPSKLGKSKEAKKETTTPPKVEEETPAKEESSAPVIPAPETEASTTAPEASNTNQNSIGDVVPDAVTVGQAPKASAAVHATA